MIENMQMELANSADPDQTAPLEAVWSGSALSAQTCLSENWIITVRTFHSCFKTNLLLYSYEYLRKIYFVCVCGW